jgi:hypothetical protein
MKLSLFLTLSFFLVYCSCTPPDTVRLQEYVGYPAEGLFAHVPVCLLPGGLHLGETLIETEHKASVFNSGNEKISCEGIQRKTWTMLPADTTITCTFNNGRLVALETITTFINGFDDISKLCTELENTFGCLGELGLYLDSKNLTSYRRTDHVFTEEFLFNKNQKQFTEFKYGIYYTSEIYNLKTT